MYEVKKFLSLFATMTLCLAMALCTRAADIRFTFFIPPMPSPPLISTVINSPAVNGATSFSVTAKIEAQTKMLGRCDKVPLSVCTSTDWYAVPDPAVSPNPPDIRAAWVYYYINGDPADAKNVAMSYDTQINRWVATVPLDAQLITGDTITYYITAVDSLGNVTSETPSVTDEPCFDNYISSWEDSLATPLLDSCSYATSYEECGRRLSSAPGTCGAVSTMGDRISDICGEPDNSGSQSVISGSSTNIIDITGITVGAGNSSICAKMGIGGPPPAVTDSAPLETFAVFFYNPEVPDSNPVDPHVKNAFAITYVPEAMGSDPTLVKVLWSSDCVTDPDTTDPLGCKLVTAVGDHPDLKMGYSNGSIRFISKKSGTGSPYVIPYNLIGSSSGRTVVSGMTGEMNFSGGTPFWISDRTAAMSFYSRNRTISIEHIGEIGAPEISKTSCSPDGSENGLNVCPMHNPVSAGNTCRIDFLPSTIPEGTIRYHIYRSTINDASQAQLIGTVQESGLSKYTFSDAISEPHGTIFYYWLTTVNISERETRLSSASHSWCAVEDTNPPAPPLSTQAAAPVHVVSSAAQNQSIQLYWTHSTDDHAAAGSGYRVFRCADSQCTAPQQITSMVCTNLGADSNAIKNMDKMAPWTLFSEPQGCWFYGVTFRSDCSDPQTESPMSGNLITVLNGDISNACLPVLPDCGEQCIHISNCRDYNNLTSSCSRVAVINTGEKNQNGTFLTSPASGLHVILADEAGKRVGNAAVTDQNGMFHLVVDNNAGVVNLHSKYRVALVVPPDQKNGVPCDTSLSDGSGNCFVVIGKLENLTDNASKTNVVYGMNLPAPGGGRAEVGNANCDQSVDIADMILLKSAFGTQQGDADYKTWLDFDGNGIIDMSDFLVLKKYYGNELDAAPSYDATLCRPQ